MSYGKKRFVNKVFLCNPLDLIVGNANQYAASIKFFNFLICIL